jgi:hypothetical protein
MNFTSRTIYIISGDPATAERCLDELAAFGGRTRAPVIGTLQQACGKTGRNAPAAVFLDESALHGALVGETLESAVAMLAA